MDAQTERRWPVGLLAMNSLFAVIAVVSLLPSARADLPSFSVMLAVTLLLIATLATSSRTIAAPSAEAGRARLACTLGLAVGAIGLIAASVRLEIETPVLAAGLGRGGIEALFWTAAAWLVRLGGGSNPASTSQGPPPPPHRAGWTEALTAVTALILLLACAEAASSLEGWRQLVVILLVGRGIYMVLLAVACLMSCAGGIVLERRGLARLEPPVTNIARDRQTIELWGGRILAACGLGASLVCLQAAQGAYAPASTPASVADGAAPPAIGPFELLTWLGTLGTLVVVIAGALVAMYVKRRDDDSQHSAAVMTMRQQWIDRSRLLLSELLAQGERMRTRLDADDFDADLAGETLMRLRAFELQLNPVEPMPRVLLSALRSWLHEAGLHEHGRAHPTKRPTSIQDFEVTTDWLVGLGQIVLKTEWAVTSVGRDRVLEKLWSTWHSLIAYETEHRPELARIAKSAVQMRERDAATITSLLG